MNRLTLLHGLEDSVKIQDYQSTDLRAIRDEFTLHAMHTSFP
jgi:hypothetical protein